MRPDLCDALVGAGLVAVVVGLWMVDPIAALVIGGGLLMGLGLWLVRLRADVMRRERD